MSSMTPEDGGLLDRWRLLAVVSRNSTMTKADIAVAGVILDCFDIRRGYAWPSTALISRVAGISERAVKYSVSKLAAAGYFTVTRSKGGRKATNQYAPNWVKIADYVNPCVSSQPARESYSDTPETVQTVSPFACSDNMETVNAPVKNGAKTCQETVQCVAPEPTYKPIYKPTYSAHVRASDPDPTEALAHMPPSIPADSHLVEAKIARQDGAGIDRQPHPIRPTLAERPPKAESARIVRHPWPLGEAKQAQGGPPVCHPVLKSLAAMVSPPVMSSYFGKVQVREDGGTLRLIFPLAYTCRLVKDNYGDVVSRAAARHGYQAVMYDGGAPGNRAAALQSPPLARAS